MGSASLAAACPTTWTMMTIPLQPGGLRGKNRYESEVILKVMGKINQYQAMWCVVYLCHTHPLGNFILNLLAPGRFGCDLKNLIFNLVLLIGILRSLYDNALRSMLQNITGKSTLVQVMAWCRQATSHYLSQCWPRSMLPYGVIRPQWVKNKRNLFLRNQNHWFLQAFHHIYGLVQDCNNSIANALELLRSCSKPLISKCIFSVTGIHNLN